MRRRAQVPYRHLQNAQAVRFLCEALNHIAVRHGEYIPFFRKRKENPKRSVRQQPDKLSFPEYRSDISLSVRIPAQDRQ